MILGCWCTRVSWPCSGGTCKRNRTPSISLAPTVPQVNPSATFTVLQDGVVLIRDAFSIAEQQQMDEIFQIMGLFMEKT